MMLARTQAGASGKDGDVLSARHATLTLSTWALETSGCSALLLERTARAPRVAQIGPGFEQLTGYSPEDYIGREYDFLAGAATDARMVEQLRRASRLAMSCRVVIRSHRRDGTPFWNEVTLCPLEDTWGEATSIRVLQCDVTERVETRSRLERVSSLLADRQQFNSAILDGIHSAIITADPAGRVTFINRLACKTLGVSPQGSQGADLVRFLALPPDVLASLTAADRVRRLSYAFRRPDGESVDIGISMSRAFDDAHHDLGYFVAFRDLSEQLQFDMDLRRVERLAAIGTMVSGFAHEVRNPIATLRILLEALQADVAPADPSVEYLSRMMKQVHRIERLVSTSLQFGRPVAPRRALHCPAALASSALDGVLRQEKAGAARRLQVGPPPLPREGRASAPRLLLEPDLPHVLADDAQIAQVLVILLENALDAAGAADLVTLRVRAAESGRDVRFEVTDRGPGISESMMSRIFDPFFTTKPNGTGLGLSIAQQLIHENGGRIEASSVEGEGTTFAVVVPSSVGAREASICERS